MGQVDREEIILIVWERVDEVRGRIYLCQIEMFEKFFRGCDKQVLRKVEVEYMNKRRENVLVVGRVYLIKL